MTRPRGRNLQHHSQIPIALHTSAISACTLLTQVVTVIFLLLLTVTLDDNIGFSGQCGAAQVSIIANGFTTGANGMTEHFWIYSSIIIL